MARLRAQPAVPMLQKVGQHLARIEVVHRSALGDLHHDICSGSAMAFASRSMRTVSCSTVGVIPEGQQGGHVMVGLQPHTPSVTTVAAVGTTLGNVSLTAK